MVALKQVRKEKKLTQTQLAGQSGVSPSLLSYCETGRFRLSPTQARRGAEALGVNPNDVEELRSVVDGRE